MVVAPEIPPVVTRRPITTLRLLSPILAAAALGLGVSAVWFGWGGRAAERASAAPPASVEAMALAERLNVLERAVARIGASRPAAAPLAGAGAVAARVAPPEHFIMAMLHLQAALATSRPWAREYEAAASLAPPGALPPTLAEVLGSHAARGLPTEALLLERFDALTPALLQRAPRDVGLLERAQTTLRGAISAIGLAAPPRASDTHTALQRILEQLRQGRLAAALSDVATLDAGLQPLLSGWLAQARARLAVEQAVQETLLRALTSRADGPA